MASHRGDPGLNPGLVICDMWWIKWRWGRFFRVLQFSLRIFIPSIAPKSSSSIIWAGYNRPIMATVPSRLSHPTKNNNNNNKAYRIDRSRNSDGLRAGRPGFDSRQGQVFLSSIALVSALGPTQRHI
jgi:hypothetical protein